jgi:hypothetical protein
MGYIRFYIAIRRYVKGKISREEFIADWEYTQRDQSEWSKKPAGRFRETDANQKKQETNNEAKKEAAS